MQKGTLYYDTSSKGSRGGKVVSFMRKWCAEITVNGRRLRRRSRDREELERWLEEIYATLPRSQKNETVGTKRKPRKRKVVKKVGKKVVITEVPASLTKLSEFPDYYIDTETTEVWSYKKQIWHKLKLSCNHYGSAPYYNFTIDGRHRTVYKGRLLFSIVHEISYYAIPKGVGLVPSKDKVDIKNFAEYATNYWKKQKEHNHDYRIKDLRRCIANQQLLLKAYLGNCVPLLQYVKDNEGMYLYILQKRLSYQNSKVAFDLALDRLLENLVHTSSRIYNFDGWFVKTALGLFTQQRKGQQRLFEYNDNIISKTLKKLNYGTE